MPQPHRSRRPRLGMRETFRFLLAASLAVAAVQFLRFASYVTTGAGTPPARPTVADVFLPLGGATALKTWIATGRIDQLHPAAMVVLIATIVTAWLFRRALCSWLCPIGMLSEYLARLGVRMADRNVRVPKWLDRTLIALKYAVSFAIVYLLFATPASAAEDFMRSPFYAVADMKLFSVYSGMGTGVVITVLVLMATSIFVRGAWCRYACPYGALQGILGVLSPVSLVKDDAACTHCGRCSKACPNAVDVAGAVGAVTSAECMGCTSCVSACPKAGTLTLRVGRSEPIPPQIFGAAFLVVFFGIVAVATAAGHWGSSLTAGQYRDIFQVAASVRLPF